MGIIQYPAKLAGQEGVIGSTKFMVSTDSLATITTAGYLNNIDLAVYPIFSSDVISCLYNYNTQTNSGTLAIFNISITNGVIKMTTWTNPGDVLLPVTDQHFASFNGTSGQIKDSGIVPSNPAKPKVASINAATLNHIAVYTDGSGTIGVDATPAINVGSIQAGINGNSGQFVSYPTSANSGTLNLFASDNTGNFNVSITNAAVGANVIFTIPNPQTSTASFLLNQGLNKMQPNSSLFLDHVTGTEAANAITLSGQSGVITTSSLTTPAASKYLITWTNTAIATSSIINLFWMGGTNNIGNLTFSATAGAGTSTITIFNNDDINALNGTLLLGFTIF